MHFYVNNPKTDADIFTRETIFMPLTLFKGGVTLVNKIIRIFVADISF